MTKRLSIFWAIAALLLFAGGFMLLTSQPAFAQVGVSISSGLQDAAGQSGYDTGGNLPTFIGNIISALLAFTGMIFLVITVYAGVMYMTAAGDEGKVKKAKSMLSSSIIGLLIVIGAYAFTSFVVEQIGDAADATTAETSAST